MSSSSPGKKSIVLLLQNFILDRIGLLEQADELTTKVIMEKAFGERGDWRARLREELGLTADLDDQLKAMWKQAQSVAAQSGSSLSAREFAEMVVEQNFQDTVELVNAELS